MTALILRDLRLAVRTLLKAPAVTTAVVTTMALGIGGAVSMFTIVDSILLRPLPFPESDRVVMLCETNPRVSDRCIASPANVADWARASRLLESAGVARGESFIARNEDGASGVAGGIATPGFFRVLRTKPAMGRLFEDPDMNRGSNNVVLISDSYWRRALRSDPAAVGRALTLDGRAFIIAGVLAADAFIPELTEVEIWKPLTASVDNIENRAWRGFLAIGRLKAGVPPAAFRAELDTMRGRLAVAFPESNAEWGVQAVGLRDRITAPVRTAVWMFFGATTLVLLIACANVAGLLLVRASRRASEFAVRVALGAGKGRLAQQLLAESAVISAAGGALGLLLAGWLTQTFVAFAPSNVPRLDEVAIDARVAMFTIVLAAATAVVFGITPARYAMKTDVDTLLKGRRHGSAGELRLRSLLVIGQMALAFMLLVGAGLLTRTFVRFLDWTPGFARDGLVTSWMLAPSSTYRTAAAAVAVLEHARDAAATTPGVQAVALASAGPLFGGVETGTLTIQGRPGDEFADRPINWFDVSPEYFQVLGVAMLRGRPFTVADTSGAPPVAIVNETLAKRFFGDADPLGQRVTVMKHTSEIVGVVADTRPHRPDQPTPPEIYWPIRQYPRLAAWLVMRVDTRTEGLEKTIRRRVASVDPNLQLTALVSLDERFSRALVSPRFNVLLLSLFAFIAIALAALGVFGVMTYSIASRTRELGVRIALGATPRRLVAGVVRHGLTLAAAGMVLGIGGAVMSGRLLGTMLYGLAPTDRLTLVLAAGGFALIALLASYLPARRAGRIDPVTALRHE